jgi:hypothetical protein
MQMLGTAVYWHATINPRCGIANVSVDNDAGVLVDASNGTSTNSTPIPAILFARSGLESGRSHLINITLFALGELGGPYMEMYNLTCVYTALLYSFYTCRADRASDRYTQDNSASITSRSASSSTETSSSPNAEAVDRRSTGTIAGAVVGSVWGVGLILCFIFFVFRRRLRHEDPLGVYHIIDSTTFLLNLDVATPYIDACKSASIRVPPRPTVPASQLQPQRPLSSSPTIDSETTPSGNSQTTNISPPQSSMLPLTPNRNESAPSVLEDPPPPYAFGRSWHVFITRAVPTSALKCLILLSYSLFCRMLVYLKAFKYSSVGRHGVARISVVWPNLFLQPPYPSSTRLPFDRMLNWSQTCCWCALASNRIGDATGCAST